MHQNWDIYFIRMAGLVASKSKDTTKVGAVIVGPDNEVRSTGYNALPTGVATTSERSARPLKYAVTVHGEVNAICLAARAGTALKGCRLYLNFKPEPCAECSKAIIQAGIIEVIGPNRPFVSANSAGRADWEASFVISRQMLTEAGVKMTEIEVPPLMQDELNRCWEA